MTDSVEYRLGSLDARMTNVESSVTTIATDQKSISSKLDQLLARDTVKRHSWKAIVGGLTAITAVIEGAHQLVKLFHGGH